MTVFLDQNKLSTFEVISMGFFSYCVGILLIIFKNPIDKFGGGGV